MTTITGNFEKLKAQALTTLAARPAERPCIFVAMGTCSRAAGAEAVLAIIRERLATDGIEADVVETGCNGACWAEPMVDLAVPGRPRVSYGPLTPPMAVALINDTLLGGDPHPDWALAVVGKEPWQGIPSWREHPFFAGQERIVLANCGLIDPTSIEEYIARDGYAALARALAEMTPQQVIAEVKDSGLRGRGGAGFPAGLKWEFTAQAPGDVKYIICNADESEPGTFKDRLIMEGDPHRLVESMAIAGYAVGAHHGVIYIRGEYPLAAERLEVAIQHARERGLLGDRILGSDFTFDVEIHRSAGAYICGEETALIESLEGRRAEPRVRPPYPPTYGLYGKPTVVNNVETLAAVPPILRRGAGWFRSFGTEKSAGTKVYTLLGDVNRPGAVEVPLGLTLRQAVEEYGGGIPSTGSGQRPEDRELKLAQVGGSAGAIVPAELADEPMDYEAHRRVGLTLGSGAVLVGDEDQGVLDLLQAVMEFFVAESCGKCIPCREGTVRVNEILARLAQGTGSADDLIRLEELTELLELASFCALGQFAALPLASALTHFRAELEAGIGQGKGGQALWNECYSTGQAGAPLRPLSPADDGRKEDWRELVARCPAGPEALVDALREVYATRGYIPRSAMAAVAEALKVPYSLVHSAATFYDKLSVVPKGQHIVRYCRNAPCHLRGAVEVLEALQDVLGVRPGQTTEDGRFTLEPVNCLGLCAVAPVIMVDDVVYGNLTPEKIRAVLGEHR
ncbi:MAG: NADH-quinone oxidoreductase subunit NuoF [Anaerolineae bacterium]